MPYQNLNILLADDDLEDLELIEDAIMNINPDIKLKKVTNGSEVLKTLDKIADSELPCLVILDYNMPELNGAQILQQLKEKERYKNIPRVILSTSSAPMHIEECLGHGAVEYFVKPNNMRELVTIVQKMLNICGLAA